MRNIARLYLLLHPLWIFTPSHLGNVEATEENAVEWINLSKNDAK